MDTKTFTTTPAKLQALSVMLAGHGIALDPTQPKGSAIVGKWDLSWTIAPTDDAPYETVAITVNHHPFGEEGMMWDKLGEILN